MQNDEFRKWSHWAAEWGADYRKSVEARPVRPQSHPGGLLSQLPPNAPEASEAFQTILDDFERLIVPGITHWQHPRFFAYFPSNSSPPSVLAEYLVASLSPQCMIWQTSPAAAELETRMLEWFAQAVGLPSEFSGVIQDTASSATLAAIMTMREIGNQWTGNQQGLYTKPCQRVYASELVHSSIDRAIWIAGIGQENLIRIPVIGEMHSMSGVALREAIQRDLAAGFQPIGVVTCAGGTSFGSCDDHRQIIPIAREFGLFVHVDAAWAGSAMICPEFREMWEGVEGADSIVVNPHKWLGIQFDCCTHYLRNPRDLIRTLAIHPEYLKTFERSGAIDYCEWTIQLGRKFRALKMWFVFRHYGLEGLRQMIRNHVNWAHQVAERIEHSEVLELCTRPALSLMTFAIKNNHSTSSNSPADTDELTYRLLNRLNDDGFVYLSSTKFNGRFVIRFQVGQFETTWEHISQAIDHIEATAKSLMR